MEIIKCELNYLDELSTFCDKITLHLAQNINYPKWTHKEYPGYESSKFAIEEGNQYICLDNNKIIGMFILNENPQGDYSSGDWALELNDGEYLVIHSLATDPEVHHKGIGKAMINYCIDTAKERGYKAIRLDVVPTNTPAIGLYESMGFKYTGTRDLKRNIAEIPEFMLYELNF